MKNDPIVRFLLTFAALAAALLSAYLFLRYLLRWLLPFLLALGISALLEPLIVRARRHLRLKRGFTAAVATLASLVMLGAGMFWLFSALLEQTVSLLTGLPVLLSELPALLEHWRIRFLDLCESCPEPIRQWGASLCTQFPALSLLSDVSAALLAKLPSLMALLPELALAFATTVLAVFYTSSCYPQLRAFLLRQVPQRYRGDARSVKNNVCLTMVRWLRAEALLWLLTFSVLLAGLLLLRVEYALILAFLIAFVDLLPVLGTGTVLLPWAAAALLFGRGAFAVGLLVLQLLLLIQRSILEPKLLAAQADLPPLAALLAMYLGFCSMGISGMIVFPFLLLLLKQLHDAGCLHLWK